MVLLWQAVGMNLVSLLHGVGIVSSIVLVWCGFGFGMGLAWFSFSFSLVWVSRSYDSYTVLVFL